MNRQRKTVTSYDAVVLRLEVPTKLVHAITRELFRLCVGTPSVRTTISEYFDTPDWKLGRKALSLCIRSVERHQTRVIAPLYSYPADRRAALDLPWKRHTRDVLQHMFKVRVRETTFLIRYSASQIEARLIRGNLRYRGRTVPICEIHVTLVSGSRHAQFDVARMLSDLAPVRLRVQSEAERGYTLSQSRKPQVESRSRVNLNATMRASEAFQLVGRACIRQLLANEGAMLAGSPEGLHQMRIALRRLRAGMSFFADVVSDEESRKIKTELRWLSGVLGPVRDLDVLLAHMLARRRHQQPGERGLVRLCREIESRRKVAYREAAAAVRSKRFVTMTMQTLGWIEAGKWTTKDGDAHWVRGRTPIKAYVGKELSRRRRGLKDKGVPVQQLSVARRHKLRIRAKKLRHAIEFVSGLHTRKKAAGRLGRAYQAVGELQSALGILNDIAGRRALVSNVVARVDHSTRPSHIGEMLEAGIVVGAKERQRRRLIAAAEDARVRFLELKPFWK